MIIEQQIPYSVMLAPKFEKTKNLVIASGGGVVLNPKNMQMLRRNSINVFIFADSDVIRRRIVKSRGRPSLVGKKLENEIDEIWKQRRTLYLRYADYVWDDTSGESIVGNYRII